MTRWQWRRALYALLMLLPQSDAFKTLHARLHSVPPLALLHPNPDPASLDPGRASAAEPGAGTTAREAPDVSTAAADGPGASSNGGARDRGPSRSGSRGGEGRVEFGPLLALFRARQQAHAEDEEARRAATNEASSVATGMSMPADAGYSGVVDLKGCCKRCSAAKRRQAHPEDMVARCTASYQSKRV